MKAIAGTVNHQLNLLKPMLKKMLLNIKLVFFGMVIKNVLKVIVNIFFVMNVVGVIVIIII